MWYQDGTVDVTNGSTQVVGHDTYFSVAVKPGDIFTGDRDKLFMIVSVADDTHMTIWPAWDGPTATAATYNVIRNFTASTSADLAANMTKIVASWQQREDEFKNWLAGTTTGGPNSDGRYPLTDAEGNTFLLASPAKLTDWLHDGIAHTAEEIVALLTDDVDRAEIAANETVAARDVTVAARDVTVAARDVTVLAETGAVQAATTATEKALEATTAKNEIINQGASLISQATAQATLASDKASAAATSEINAKTSETNAGLKATAAAASETSSALSRDEARDWATKMDAKVGGLDWSAKHYWNQTVTLHTATSGFKDAAAASAADALESENAAAASASTANAKATLTAADALKTAADATTTTTKAQEAAASATLAGQHKDAALEAMNTSVTQAGLASDRAGAAAASATAADGSKVAVEAMEDNVTALHGDVVAKATQVSNNLQTVQTYTAEADASKIASMQAATDAVGAKVDAVNAKDQSVAARDLSVQARDLAQAFANSAQGYQITPGTYSSYHWAMEAKGYAQTAATIVGGSNFGIIGDGTSQRFAAAGPGSILHFVQGAGGKVTFNPANWSVSFGFDATTAKINAIDGMAALTVQDAVHELYTELSTLSQDTITQAGGSVSVGVAGQVEIAPAVGQTATYKGSEIATKAETDAALGLKADKATTYTKTETDTLVSNAQTAGAAKLTTARTIALSGGVTGTATAFDGTANITIPVTEVAASSLTGTIDIARLPAGSLERLHPVADDTERFALTTAQVQKGDTVQVGGASGPMYVVIDESNLGNANGYRAYTASRASAVDWTGVENKPALLNAIAALDASNGVVVQTGAGTVAKRAIGVASATDIPDRAAADTRYAGFGANAYTGAQTTSLPAVSTTLGDEVIHGKRSSTSWDDHLITRYYRAAGDAGYYGNAWEIGRKVGALGHGYMRFGGSMTPRLSWGFSGNDRLVLPSTGNMTLDGNTVYTSGNLTISNYAPLVSPDFSGTPKVSSNVIWHAGNLAPSQNVVASSMAQRDGTGGLAASAYTATGANASVSATATTGDAALYLSAASLPNTNYRMLQVIKPSSAGNEDSLYLRFHKQSDGTYRDIVINAGTQSMSLFGSAVLKATDADANANGNTIVKRDSGGGVVGVVLNATSAAPATNYYNTAAAIDNRIWQTVASGNTIYHRVNADDWSSYVDYLTVTRSGVSVTGIDYKIAPTVNGTAMATTGVNVFFGKQHVTGAGTCMPASTSLAQAGAGTGGLELQSQWNGPDPMTAGAAFISFHRSGNYAVHFGLDTDNKLKVGGWTMGNNAYEIWHSNSLPVTVSGQTVDFKEPPTVNGQPVGGGEDTATSIAAAATVDLGSTTAKAIKVTSGTGPITAWGTAPAGAHRDITFATAVVLAYNASTAILTGGSSISAMVGDTCRMESLGGGAWKMLSYQRANGMPLGAVSSQSLSSSDKSANATLADNNMSVNSTGGIASGRATTSITTPTYWEVVVNSIVTNSIPGIASAAAPVSDYLTNSAYGWGYLPSGVKGNSGQGLSFGASWGNSDRLCFAYHPTSRGFWMGKVVGGVAVWGGSGDPVAGANPAYTIPTGTAVFPSYSVVGTGSSLTFAFGSNQQVATPPSGFLAFT